MSLQLRAASRTDVGRARESNEDACFAGDHVFAVADGLGGHAAGEIASNLALEPLAALDGQSPKRAAEGLADAVRRANRSVYDRALSEAGLRGMGTTITAVAVHDGTATIAHVGDSRCYLIRDGTISQLSRDHTLVGRMVEEGKLTPAQAESHPQRSILTRAIGAEPDIDVEETRIELCPGDRVLLCSDGLSGLLSDEEMRELAAAGDIDSACSALVEEANERGGPDNITAVLVDVGGTLPPRATPAQRRERRERRERRVPLRPLVWVALLATLLIGSVVGVQAWAGRSYYVGLADRRVVIYRGIPLEVAGMTFREIAEPTSLKVEDVRLPSTVRALRAGITVESLADGRRLIEDIRRTSLAPRPRTRTSPTRTPP